MFLLFNMLSRFVIAFVSRSKCPLISRLQSPSTVILEQKKNKVCHCLHHFPNYLPWRDGIGCHDHSFLNIELYFTLLLAFIKRLFSSSSFSAIRVISSAHLRLLIFLPTILNPPCESSSLAFRMMYSAYMLNNQGDIIQPWRTPFPIWNQSVVPCLLLLLLDLHTGFWPAYRFLRKQIR